LVRRIDVKGVQGKQGATGARGQEPPECKKLLELVQAHIDRIDPELDVQLTRIAEIQREVDLLRANLKRLATA
jgi:hypothetical protein